MAALCDLHTAALIEKDSHGDVMWTWSYPTVTNDTRNLLLRKSCLSGENSILVPLVFFQFRKLWHYMYTTPVEFDSLKKVTHISLVLIAKDYNPEKYEDLSKILTKLYCRTGNPAMMLESYLSVVTKGTCNGEENGMFSTKDYDVRQAYAAGSLKDIIVRFGLETILIYTAILLKKRVAVYHSSLRELLSCVRVLPALVWHRQNWSVLFPFVELEEVELKDLKSNSSYVAGFTNPSIENRSDLFDVFVNLSSSDITVSPHAKEYFTMGKLHKDIALHMMQSAEDTSKSEQQTIKNVALKTKELLNNLRSLSTSGENAKPVITLETLKGRKMAPATENFLFNLASAEGWVPLR